MNTIKLRQQLEQFFLEDIGDGDYSSELLFGDHEMGEMTLLAKEAGIFCGVSIIETGFTLLNPEALVEMQVTDGAVLKVGQPIAIITGRMVDLLKAERVVLNLIQRMSGIATLTSKAVNTLENSSIKIADTRKTTPGLRMFEKYAVRCGGGYNHRMGLYDAVMIKDNHIAFAGSITNAVMTLRSRLGHMVKVEVETECKEDVLEAVNAGVDVIMFDNRKAQEIKEWIKFVPDTIITEASGGISLDNLRDYRNTGVHVISLGFLTHSAKALDISAKVK